MGTVEPIDRNAERRPPVGQVLTRSDNTKGEHMTRKDYELIAQVIAGTRERYPDNMATAHIVGVLGSRLKGENPRFDFPEFMKACGL